MLEPTYLILAILILLVSYAGVSWLRRWGEKKGILDIPNERSSHSRPVPRGGGLIIVFVTLAGWLIFSALYQDFPLFSVLAYACGAAAIALVSWLDDLQPLPTAVRILVHGAGSVAVIMAFGYPDLVQLPYFGRVFFGWAGLPLALIWMIGLTNAYNFMDGIDGIAGGQGVAAGAGWFILGWLSGQHLLSITGLLLAAGCLGFLAHNWPPARIFMGDVGSTFIGFTLAALPVIAVRSDPRLLAAGALLIWPFVFDAGYTFICRLLRGEKISAAHRSHLYQRLVIAGFSHRSVSLLYTFLAVAGAALSITWFIGWFNQDWLVYALLGSLCLGLWLFVMVTGLYKRVAVWRVNR